MWPRFPFEVKFPVGCWIEETQWGKHAGNRKAKQQQKRTIYLSLWTYESALRIHADACENQHFQEPATSQYWGVCRQCLFCFKSSFYSVHPQKLSCKRFFWLVKGYLLSGWTFLGHSCTRSWGAWGNFEVSPGHHRPSEQNSIGEMELSWRTFISSMHWYPPSQCLYLRSCRITMAYELWALVCQ